jgi:hypothetical protein
MNGRGDLVNYTRYFEQGPLSPHEKEVLKKKVNDIIDAASGAITIIALVEALPKTLIDNFVKEILDEVHKK